MLNCAPVEDTWCFLIAICYGSCGRSNKEPSRRYPACLMAVQKKLLEVAETAFRNSACLPMSAISDRNRTKEAVDLFSTVQGYVKWAAAGWIIGWRGDLTDFINNKRSLLLPTVHRTGSCVMQFAVDVKYSLLG